jgi:hypothetical protein
VEKLEEIAEILGSKGFCIIGYAFDEDSCFNILHSQFQQHYHTETLEKALTIMIFKNTARRVIISDPLHILKRIRYRLLSGRFRIGVGNDQTEFRIENVGDKLPLPPIVFDNSRITKMYDSLPLELFSQAALHQIFHDCLPQVFFTFFPWFRMVSCLASRNFSTRAPCNIFETAFWLLYFY